MKDSWLIDASRHRGALLATARWSPRWVVGVASLFCLFFGTGNLSRNVPSAPPDSSPRVITPQTEVHIDFDGDGVADRAVIGDGSDREGVRVSLSSRQSLWLPEHVGRMAGLAADDFDHDGDTDLVGSSATGQLIVWLNDGHGRFSLLAPHATEPRRISVEQAWDADRSDGDHVAVLARIKTFLGHVPRARIFNPLPVVADVSAHQPFAFGVILRAPGVPRGPPLA